MTLTEKDLQQIRVIVREEATSIVGNSTKILEKRLDSIENSLQALENVIRKI